MPGAREPADGAAVTDPPRCRRPLKDDESQARGLGEHCFRLLRRKRRVRQGFPGIRAYRAYGHVPGQTVIPIDDRTRP